MDTIFIDLRKAFDSVPHNELLMKLWKMGITGKLWLWFKDYLSNRKHYVQLGHVSSELLPVRSGEPQGSILGPLFSSFILTICPLVSLTHHAYSLLMMPRY